jgi:hypothetical protein
MIHVGTKTTEEINKDSQLTTAKENNPYVLILDKTSGFFLPSVYIDCE